MLCTTSMSPSPLRGERPSVTPCCENVSAARELMAKNDGAYSAPRIAAARQTATNSQ